MSNHWTGHLALFSAQLIYALNYSIAKDLMPELLHPFTLVFFRITGAGLLFWIAGVFVRSEKMEPVDYVKLFKLCLLGVVFNQFFFITGLCYTTPINSALIMITSPILVFVLGIILNREPLRWNVITGLALAMTGALLMLLFKGHFQWGSETLAGDLMTVINACSWSLFLIYSKPLLFKYHTLTVMKWLFLFGFIISCPLGLSRINEIHLQDFNLYSWLSLGFVVIATTFLAYLLNVMGLKRLNAVTTGAYIFLQPFLASWVAYLLGKDALNTIKLLSGLCILGGLSLIHFHTFTNKSHETR